MDMGERNSPSLWFHFRPLTSRHHPHPWPLPARGRGTRTDSPALPPQLELPVKPRDSEIAGRHVDPHLHCAHLHRCALPDRTPGAAEAAGGGMRSVASAADSA